jgi:hypothetical protein
MPEPGVGVGMTLEMGFGVGFVVYKLILFLDLIFIELLNLMIFMFKC